MIVFWGFVMVGVEEIILIDAGLGWIRMF